VNKIRKLKAASVNRRHSNASRNGKHLGALMLAPVTVAPWLGALEMTAPVFERGLGPFLMHGGECRDLTRALPKFYGVAVNEKQGALFSGLIVIAKDIDAMHDVSVSPYRRGNPTCPKPDQAGA
jgi:hypothetical protein